MLTRPDLTAVEKENLTKPIDTLMKGLSTADQQKATALRAEPRPTNYWFQPEYANTRVIFEQAQHPIYDLFRLYSGPTHGGFALKFLFNDDPALETIDPQEHAGKVPMAIIASTRILAEITHMRDNWENADAHERQYTVLIRDIVALRT